MRFVEEEHELRLVEIADLGQSLEQLRQQPQKTGAVEARALHQAVGRQDVDHTGAACIDADHVGEVECGFAEEALAALLLQDQQLALDGANAGLAHVAVFDCEGTGILRRPLQHGLQVLEVE